MEIRAVNQPGTYRTGSLNYTLRPQDIAAVLGFDANVEDDADKVRFSWGFTADGEQCGIWDYKGWRWSTFGPREVFVKLFGAAAVTD